MFKVYINGEEKKDVNNTCRTVTELVEHASKDCVPTGEIISQVKVNGEVVLWKQNLKELSQCSRIEITTCEAKGFLISGMLEAYRLSSSIQEQLRKIADGLGTLQHQNSLKEFLEIADTLQWLYGVLSGAKHLLGISFSDISTGEDFTHHVDKLKAVLTGACKALQEENYVLFSDMIRYELIPCMEELESLLPSLIKAADKKFASLS